MENRRDASITFVKWLKSVLAAQDIDGWLNIFHGSLEFVIVLTDMVAYGCGSRVWPTSE